VVVFYTKRQQETEKAKKKKLERATLRFLASKKNAFLLFSFFLFHFSSASFLPSERAFSLNTLPKPPLSVRAHDSLSL